MKHSFENNTLTIFLEGQITSSNAEAFTNDIAALVAETQPTSMVFEASDLEFTSSAGLRVIMRFVKIVREVSVVGASPEVYKVFEMTGLTQIIDVRQAR